MTNRSSTLGAMAWVLVAAMLASVALEPVSVGAAQQGCVKSSTDIVAKCAPVA